MRAAGLKISSEFMSWKINRRGANHTLGAVRRRREISDCLFDLFAILIAEFLNVCETLERDILNIEKLFKNPQIKCKRNHKPAEKKLLCQLKGKRCQLSRVLFSLIPKHRTTANLINRRHFFSAQVYVLFRFVHKNAY